MMPVARPGDSHPWERGLCWLYCRRDGVDVLFLGDVSTPNGRSALYGCGDCVAELSEMVWRAVRQRDRA